MKLNTHIFITAVMKLLDITFTTKIPNLLKKNVKEGIKRVLQLIRTRGFNVISMTTDGEFADAMTPFSSSPLSPPLLSLLLTPFHLCLDFLNEVSLCCERSEHWLPS
jgi:hypothetical protein